MTLTFGFRRYQGSPYRSVRRCLAAFRQGSSFDHSLLLKENAGNLFFIVAIGPFTIQSNNA